MYCRRIWMDISEPVERVPARGEYVVTRGKNGFGSAYLVMSCREVKRVRRKTPERRFALTVQPGHAIADAIQCNPWWVLEWYSRAPRRKV